MPLATYVKCETLPYVTELENKYLQKNKFSLKIINLFEVRGKSEVVSVLSSAV
jgi:hypothetical protein